MRYKHNEGAFSLFSYIYRYVSSLFFILFVNNQKEHKGNESILCWQSTLVVDGFVVLFSVKYTPKWGAFVWTCSHVPMIWIEYFFSPLKKNYIPVAITSIFENESSKKNSISQQILAKPRTIEHSFQTNCWFITCFLLKLCVIVTITFRCTSGSMIGWYRHSLNEN